MVYDLGLSCRKFIVASCGDGVLSSQCYTKVDYFLLIRRSLVGKRIVTAKPNNNRLNATQLCYRCRQAYFSYWLRLLELTSHPLLLNYFQKVMVIG